jgi:hypothetical protein
MHADHENLLLCGHTQDEDVALAIAIANSLKDMARSQSELAELEQVCVGEGGRP